MTLCGFMDIRFHSFGCVVISYHTDGFILSFDAVDTQKLKINKEKQTKKQPQTVLFKKQ